MRRSENLLLATLAYSDVFDYPLTKAQLLRFLIASKSISLATLNTLLEEANLVNMEEGFYFLSGKKSLIATRQKRQKISKRKLQKILPITHFLQKIPTIMCIGISGSLAMENAEHDADVDLFLITSPNALWITRLLVLLLLEVKRVRRKRTDKKAKDKICVNMLVDIDHMTFSKDRRDIYTAHEIAQMKVIFSREYTYEAFLFANKWVRSILPNSIHIVKPVKRMGQRISILTIFEPVAKMLQLWHMQRHRTKETITDGFVALHPDDYKETILSEWEKRKKKYGI